MFSATIPSSVALYWGEQSCFEGSLLTGKWTGWLSKDSWASGSTPVIPMVRGEVKPQIEIPWSVMGTVTVTLSVKPTLLSPAKHKGATMVSGRMGGDPSLTSDGTQGSFSTDLSLSFLLRKIRIKKASAS